MDSSGGEGKIPTKRACAITGIAADLLKYVQTAHSGFKIHISTIEASVAGMKLSSHKSAN
jgi:hypothetical protein